MPTYDYECTSCGYVFEKFHSMSETPAVNCEKCGSNANKKIGAGNGIIFKGSGFYVNDYKSCSKGASSAGCACPSGGSCSESK